jgi:tetratricopeptide (TPR) repeat protein
VLLATGLAALASAVLATSFAPERPALPDDVFRAAAEMFLSQITGAGQCSPGYEAALDLQKRLEARFGQATEADFRLLVAQSRSHKSKILYWLEKHKEAIVLLNEIEAAREEGAGFQLLRAEALARKGHWLFVLGKPRAAIAAFDQFEARYGAHADLEIQQIRADVFLQKIESLLFYGQEAAARESYQQMKKSLAHSDNFYVQDEIEKAGAAFEQDKERRACGWPDKTSNLIYARQWRQTPESIDPGAWDAQPDVAPEKAPSLPESAQRIKQAFEAAEALRLSAIKILPPRFYADPGEIVIEPRITKQAIAAYTRIEAEIDAELQQPEHPGWQARWWQVRVGIAKGRALMQIDDPQAAFDVYVRLEIAHRQDPAPEMRELLAWTRAARSEAMEKLGKAEAAQRVWKQLAEDYKHDASPVAAYLVALARANLAWIAGAGKEYVAPSCFLSD